MEDESGLVKNLVFVGNLALDPSLDGEGLGVG